MKDLTETAIDSELVYDGSFLQMRRDRVRLPNGRESGREFIVHPGAAVMIPLFADGRILVERQYRYPVGMTMTEMPAGKIDPGESALQTAKRELAEETGYRAREWAFLTRLHPAVGFANEVLDLFLCRELEAVEHAPDEDEFLELEIVTLDWLVDEMRAGRLSDAKTQISVFWLERLFSGAWPWPVFERDDDCG